jgi:hypothetical protein
LKLFIYLSNAVAEALVSFTDALDRLIRRRLSGKSVEALPRKTGPDPAPEVNSLDLNVGASGLRVHCTERQYYAAGAMRFPDEKGRSLPMTTLRAPVMLTAMEHSVGFVQNMLSVLANCPREKRVETLENLLASALKLMDEDSIVEFRALLSERLAQGPDFHAIMDLIEGHLALRMMVQSDC